MAEELGRQTITFHDFVFEDHRNRKYLWLAVATLVIQFSILKLLYPFADYFQDSYSYLETAQAGTDFNIWPVGYSKVLYFFHLITHSDTAVVAFQYFFAGAALLLFYFTVLYWYSPPTAARRIIFVFLFCNPLLFYLSNCISSDALFIAVSLLWLTQLLWIIYESRPRYIWLHALLITLAFTIRYNAMYYPLLSAIAFLFSSGPWHRKVAGILLPLALIGAFIAYTRGVGYRVTGTRQFSVFSGWQWANNALYIYPHIHLDPAKLPPQTLALDSLVKGYFDTIPEHTKYASPLQGAFYMQQEKAPLKQYLSAYLRKKGKARSQAASWGAVSPVFGAYGRHIAQNHPGAYAVYYVLPNAINYFLPPLEKLEVYNLGRPELLNPVPQRWFEYNRMQLDCFSFDFQGRLFYLFPAIFLLSNLGLIVVLVAYFAVNRRKYVPRAFHRSLLLIIALFVTNMTFSMLASPIVFRYQVFPMIVYVTFCLIVYGRIEKTPKESRIRT